MHQVYNQIFSVLDEKTILCTFKIILCGFRFFTGKISLGRWMPICSVQKQLSKRNITSKPKIVSLDEAYEEIPTFDFLHYDVKGQTPFMSNENKIKWKGEVLFW